jgi:hypothetical protein
MATKTEDELRELDSKLIDQLATQLAAALEKKSTPDLEKIRTYAALRLIGATKMLGAV